VFDYIPFPEDITVFGIERQGVEAEEGGLDACLSLLVSLGRV